MKRLRVFDHAAPYADNMRHASRISRKIQGAHQQAECVLVDCEHVGATKDFLRILLRNVMPEKIKFCGLPISIQIWLYESGRDVSGNEHPDPAT